MARGKETTFSSGVERQLFRVKFSDDLVCHIVIVSDCNSSETFWEQVEEAKSVPLVNLYVLSGGIHPNNPNVIPQI
jgi:hypothetical protein